MASMEPGGATRRRLLLRGSAGVAGVLAVTGLAGDAGDAAPAAASSRWHGKPGSSGVTLRWLGNNAWEVTFGTTTILIDPWVTRFPTGTYTTGTRADTPLVIDEATVD